MVLRDHLKAAQHWLTAPAGSQTQSKALAPYRGESVIELKSSDALAAVVRTQVGIDQYPKRDYAKLLPKVRTNPIVRRCFKLVAESVAAIAPVVKRAGQEDDRISEAVAQFFKRPNPNQDRFAFVRDAAGFDCLGGNVYIEGVTGFTSGFVQVYALRPERMTITPGANGWPAIYKYKPGTGAEKWWHVDVEHERKLLLHVKDFNPSDDHYGCGALEAADLPLNVYENAQAMANALLSNGAVMSGAFAYKPQVPAGSAPPVLSEEQRGSILNALREFTAKGKKAGGMMLLPSSLEWLPIATNLVDLQAEEIRRSAARDIANAFGVPSLLLGLPGDNTYANFTEASRAFYRNTVIPAWMRLHTPLARWLGVLLGIDGLEFELDEDELWALSEDLAMRSGRIEGSGVLTIEEKREALGWDRVPPPGDTFLLPGGLVSLDDILNADLGIYGNRADAEGGSPPEKKPKKD